MRQGLYLQALHETIRGSVRLEHDGFSFFWIAAAWEQIAANALRAFIFVQDYAEELDARSLV